MADAKAIAEAAECLAAGGLVAMPTETVYGLAADATNDVAVSRIFEAKGRPAGHPLIVHIASASQVGEWTTSTDPRISLLAQRFWPGPLTIVVPRTERVSSVAVGGLETVALRVPNHPVALALLKAFGGGVAAPSANRFGRVSPTTAAHVFADLGDRVDVVLDGGASEVGVESTIVEIVGDSVTLLRPGGVSIDELEEALGEPVLDGTSGRARASGMMASHYAPTAAVRVVEADHLALVSPSSAVIVPFATDRERAFTLPADSAGFAAGLYAALREADQMGVDEIAVVLPDHGPLLAALVDRIGKAAAPRPPATGLGSTA